MPPIEITYRFTFQDKTKTEFVVRLDKETLQLIPNERTVQPSWTELKHCQCPNCPLKVEKEKYCPVAFNLADLTDFFKTSVSFEEVELEIETKERGYFKKVPLQRGISSLMGIYMATSGCPILDKLKPMVRSHLPFANIEETQYRVLAMYLLAQYFRNQKGEKPDWDLKGLSKIYEEIHVVNKAFAGRLRSVQGEDAVPNAVVILDNFADAVTFSLDQSALQKIEKLFEAYFIKN